MKKQILLLFISSILFLGIFIVDSQQIVIDYHNKEETGFINEEEYYYLQTYSVPKVFHNYTEMIEHARNISDSFIIIAKISGKKYAVYYENYPWNPPLISGRLFSENELLSMKQTEISNNENAIGIPVNDNIYYNLLSVPLIVEKGFANAAICSNINLSEEYCMNNTLKVIDSMIQLKLVLYMILFYLSIIIIFLLYVSNIYREVIVRKFLGNSLLSVCFSFTIRILAGLLASFLIGIGIFVCMFPEILLYEITRNAFLSVCVYRLLTTEFIALLGTALLAVIIRFVPVKKIGEMGVYND